MWLADTCPAAGQPGPASAGAACRAPCAPLEDFSVATKYSRRMGRGGASPVEFAKIRAGRSEDLRSRCWRGRRQVGAAWPGGGACVSANFAVMCLSE
jgi:hypothetical protein